MPSQHCVELHGLKGLDRKGNALDEVPSTGSKTNKVFAVEGRIIVRVDCESLDGTAAESADILVPSDGRVNFAPPVKYNYAPVDEGQENEVFLRVRIYEAASILNGAQTLLNRFHFKLSAISERVTWIPDEEGDVALNACRCVVAPAVSTKSETVETDSKVEELPSTAVVDVLAKTELPSEEDETHYSADFDADSTVQSSPSVPAVSEVSNSATDVPSAIENVSGIEPNGTALQDVTGVSETPFLDNTVSTQSSTLFSGMLETTKDDFAHTLSASSLHIPTMTSTIIPATSAATSPTAQDRLKDAFLRTLDDYPTRSAERCLSTLWLSAYLHTPEDPCLWAPPAVDSAVIDAIIEALRSTGFRVTLDATSAAGLSYIVEGMPSSNSADKATATTSSSSSSLLEMLQSAIVTAQHEYCHAPSLLTAIAAAFPDVPPGAHRLAAAKLIIRYLRGLCDSILESEKSTTATVSPALGFSVRMDTIEFKHVFAGVSQTNVDAIFAAMFFIRSVFQNAFVLKSHIKEGNNLSSTHTSGGFGAADAAAVMYALNRKRDQLLLLESTISSLNASLHMSTSSAVAATSTSLLSVSGVTPSTLVTTNRRQLLEAVGRQWTAESDASKAISTLLAYSHVIPHVEDVPEPIKKGKAKPKVEKSGMTNLSEPARLALNTQQFTHIQHLFRKIDISGKKEITMRDVELYLSATVKSTHPARAIAVAVLFAAAHTHKSMHFVDFSVFFADSFASCLQLPSYLQNLPKAAQKGAKAASKQPSATATPRSLTSPKRGTNAELSSITEAVGPARAQLDAEMHVPFCTAVTQLLLVQGVDAFVLQDNESVYLQSKRLLLPETTQSLSLDAANTGVVLECLAGLGMIALTQDPAAKIAHYECLLTILESLLSEGAKNFRVVEQLLVEGPTGVSHFQTVLPQSMRDGDVTLPSWIARHRGTKTVLAAVGFVSGDSALTGTMWEVDVISVSKTAVRLCADIIRKRLTYYVLDDTFFDAPCLLLGLAAWFYGDVRNCMLVAARRNEAAVHAYDEAICTAATTAIPTPQTKKRTNVAAVDYTAAARTAARLALEADDSWDRLTLASAHTCMTAAKALDVLQACTHTANRGMLEKTGCKVSLAALGPSGEPTTNGDFDPAALFLALGFVRSGVDELSWPVGRQALPIQMCIGWLTPFVKAAASLAKLTVATQSLTSTFFPDARRSMSPVNMTASLEYLTQKWEPDAGTVPANTTTMTPLISVPTGSTRPWATGVDIAAATSSSAHAPAPPGVLQSVTAIGPSEAANLVSNLAISAGKGYEDSMHRIAQLERQLEEAQAELKAKHVAEIAAAMRASAPTISSPRLNTAITTDRTKTAAAPPPAAPKSTSTKRGRGKAAADEAVTEDYVELLSRVQSGEQTVPIRLQGAIQLNAPVCLQISGIPETQLLVISVQSSGENGQGALMASVFSEHTSIPSGTKLTAADDTATLLKSYTRKVMQRFVAEEFLPTLIKDVVALGTARVTEQRIATYQLQTPAPSTDLLIRSSQEFVSVVDAEGICSGVTGVCEPRIFQLDYEQRYLPFLAEAAYKPLSLFANIADYGQNSVTVADVQAAARTNPRVCEASLDQQLVCMNDGVTAADKNPFDTYASIWQQLLSCDVMLQREASEIVVSRHLFACLFRPLHPLDHLLLSETDVDFLATVFQRSTSGILDGTSIEYWGEEWERTRALLTSDTTFDDLVAFASVYATVHAMEFSLHPDERGSFGVSLNGAKAIQHMCNGEAWTIPQLKSICSQAGLHDTSHLSLSQLMAVRMLADQKSRDDGAVPLKATLFEGRGFTKLLRYENTLSSAFQQLIIPGAVVKQPRRVLVSRLLDVIASDPKYKLLKTYPLQQQKDYVVSLSEHLRTTWEADDITWSELYECVTHCTTPTIVTDVDAASECLELCVSEDGQRLYALFMEGLLARYDAVTGQLLQSRQVCSKSTCRSIRELKRGERCNVLRVADAFPTGKSDDYATNVYIPVLNLSGVALLAGCDKDVEVGQHSDAALHVFMEENETFKHIGAVVPTGKHGRAAIIHYTVLPQDTLVAVYRSLHGDGADTRRWIGVFDMLNGWLVADLGDIIERSMQRFTPQFLCAPYMLAALTGTTSDAQITFWRVSDVLEKTADSRFSAESNNTSELLPFAHLPLSVVRNTVYSSSSEGGDSAAPVVDMLALKAGDVIAILLADCRLALLDVQFSHGSSGAKVSLRCCRSVNTSDGFGGVPVRMSTCALRYSTAITGTPTLQPDVSIHAAMSFIHSHVMSACVLYVLDDGSTVSFAVPTNTVNVNFLSLRDRTFVDCMAVMLDWYAASCLRRVSQTYHRVAHAAVIVSLDDDLDATKLVSSIPAEDLASLGKQTTDLASSKLSLSILRHTQRVTGRRFDPQDEHDRMKAFIQEPSQTTMPRVCIFTSTRKLHCTSRVRDPQQLSFNIIDVSHESDRRGVTAQRIIVSKAHHTVPDKHQSIRKRWQHQVARALKDTRASGVQRAMVHTELRRWKRGIQDQITDIITTPDPVRRPAALSQACDVLLHRSSASFFGRLVSVMQNLAGMNLAVGEHLSNNMLNNSPMLRELPGPHFTLLKEPPEVLAAHVVESLKPLKPADVLDFTQFEHSEVDPAFTRGKILQKSARDVLLAQRYWRELGLSAAGSANDVQLFYQVIGRRQLTRADGDNASHIQARAFATSEMLVSDAMALLDSPGQVVEALRTLVGTVAMSGLSAQATAAYLGRCVAALSSLLQQAVVETVNAVTTGSAELLVEEEDAAETPLSNWATVQPLLDSLQSVVYGPAWQAAFDSVCASCKEEPALLLQEHRKVVVIELLIQLAIHSIHYIAAQPIPEAHLFVLILTPVLECVRLALSGAIEYPPSRALGLLICLSVGDTALLHEDGGAPSGVSLSYVGAVADTIEPFVKMAFGQDFKGNPEWNGLRKYLAACDTQKPAEMALSNVTALLDTPFVRQYSQHFAGMRRLVTCLREATDAFALKVTSSESPASRAKNGAAAQDRPSNYWRYFPILLKCLAKLCEGTPDALLDVPAGDGKAVNRQANVAQHARVLENIAQRKQALSQISFVFEAVKAAKLQDDILSGAYLLEDFSIAPHLSALLHDPDADIRGVAFKSAAELCDWISRRYGQAIAQITEQTSSRSGISQFSHFVRRFSTCDSLLAIARRLLLLWQAQTGTTPVGASAKEELINSALNALLLLESQIRCRVFSTSAWVGSGVAAALSRVARLGKDCRDVARRSVAVMEQLRNATDNESIAHFVQTQQCLRETSADTGVDSWQTLQQVWIDTGSMLLPAAESDDCALYVPDTEAAVQSFLQAVRRMVSSLPTLHRRFLALVSNRSFSGSGTAARQVEGVIVGMWASSIVSWRLLQKLPLAHEGRSVIVQLLGGIADFVRELAVLDVSALRLFLGDSAASGEVNSIPGLDWYLEVLSSSLPLVPFEFDIARELQARVATSLALLVESRVSALMKKSTQSPRSCQENARLLTYLLSHGLIANIHANMSAHLDFVRNVVHMKVAHVHLGAYVAEQIAARNTLISSVLCMVASPGMSTWRQRVSKCFVGLAELVIADEGLGNLLRFILTDMLDDVTFLQSGIGQSSIPPEPIALLGTYPMRTEAIAMLWAVGYTFVLGERCPHPTMPKLREMVGKLFVEVQIVAAERERLWKFRDASLHASVCAALQAVVNCGVHEIDDVFQSQLRDVAIPEEAIAWLLDARRTITGLPADADVCKAAYEAWANWRASKMVKPDKLTTTSDKHSRSLVSSTSAAATSRKALPNSVDVAARLSANLHEISSAALFPEFDASSTVIQESKALSPATQPFDLQAAMDVLGDAIADVKDAFDALAKQTSPDGTPGIASEHVERLLQSAKLFAYNPVVLADEMKHLRSPVLSYVDVLRVIFAALTQ